MSAKQLERIRDAEAARVARWFRDGVHGLVYLDRKGRAIPISDQEHERWRTQALRRVDTYVADLERSPKETFLLAACAVAAAYFVKTMFGSFLPPLKAMEPFLFAIPACFWPMAYEFSFRRDQAALRRGISEGTMMRTPLPDDIAARQRRYNIFALGQLVTALGAVLVAGVATFRDDPGYGTWGMLIFLALAWLFSWAAGRVDATHRRRLW